MWASAPVAAAPLPAAVAAIEGPALGPEAAAPATDAAPATSAAAAVAAPAAAEAEGCSEAAVAAALAAGEAAARGNDSKPPVATATPAPLPATPAAADAAAPVGATGGFPDPNAVPIAQSAGIAVQELLDPFQPDALPEAEAVSAAQGPPQKPPFGAASAAPAPATPAVPAQLALRPAALSRADTPDTGLQAPEEPAWLCPSEAAPPPLAPLQTPGRTALDADAVASLRDACATPPRVDGAAAGESDAGRSTAGLLTEQQPVTGVTEAAAQVVVDTAAGMRSATAAGPPHTDAAPQAAASAEQQPAPLPSQTAESGDPAVAPSPAAETPTSIGGTEEGAGAVPPPASPGREAMAERPQSGGGNRTDAETSDVVVVEGGLLSSLVPYDSSPEHD